ncbi:MAG TPA: D-alanyl-D-alanine carboxypeptidase family protein [Candidatus Binataceae bacterium]|nr:D-alanyl-D-alanine carboxypeptidase family protein [Candidatus Binataceae bacterium]
MGVETMMAGRLQRATVIFLAATLVSAAVLTAAVPARANYNKPHRKHVASRHHRRARASTVDYHALLLEDADTGRIIYDYNGGIQWPPASMAKMMLLMVVEDQIKAGRFNLDSPVTVSADAAYTGGSHLGLHPGEVVPLGELMKAALIRSANDAAVAVAEGVCGSTSRCVEMMNARARSLGMTHTVYGTVEGLPPKPLHDADTTDAYDLATLARALIHQTNLLQWSRMQTASFDDGAAMLHNTNHLIGHFEGCDGLKTGFTIKAGFNLTATAKRGNMRLVAVVLGAPSNGQRFVQAAKLLDWGFDNFTKVELVKQGEPLPMHVRVGADELIQPVARRTVTVVVPKKDTGELKMDFAVPASLYGPLASDQTVGQVIVRDRSEVVAKFAAVCPLPVGQQQLPAGQQPAAVDASSAAPAEIPGQRGATIRVAAPTGQVAAPVPAVAAPMNAAVPPANQIAAPIR